ncbi:hypothetical protein [Carboxylicivirga taeanensis]|uniref:hypothetical protein n=1 Tax=Carboxylicivirga taeanensis TaxID=1416875 RepID=UPI003F6DFD33
MKSQLWSLTGKILIILLSLMAYAYIGDKLWHFNHWHQLISSLQFSTHTLGLVLLLVLLWGLNLFCETRKWQMLMRPFTHLSLVDAWHQVMAGTTTAVGSPARIAEMGGRMALLSKHLRMKAAIMTTIGGSFQSLVILSVGVTTMLFFKRAGNYVQIPSTYHTFIITGIVIILIALTASYYLSRTVRYYFRVITHIKKNSLLIALGWTTARYIIFLVQLYTWFWLFGHPIHCKAFMHLATLYFFVITIIPSHIMTDMGIRGSTALFLFSSLQISTPVIIAATFCLWASNVVLPTIIGSYILIRQKVLKQVVMKKEH